MTQETEIPTAQTPAFPLLSKTAVQTAAQQALWPGVTPDSQAMWGWLTRTLLKDLIGFNAVVMLGLLWLKPAWVGYYGVGVLLSMAYAGTLLLSVKLALGRGQSGLVMMGAFLRMMTIPWVVAVLGHFEWTPTMVVFCGCLSYKWILFFDVFRYGLRQQSHRVNSITQLGN